MAGFWDDLGRGLQDAGAILSPTVYQSQEQERQIVMRQRLAQQEANRQLMAQAIMSGAAPASAAQGLGLPQGLGPSAAAQLKQQEVQMEQKASEVVKPFLERQDYKGALSALSGIPGATSSQTFAQLSRLAAANNQMPKQPFAVGGAVAVPDEKAEGGVRFVVPPKQETRATQEWSPPYSLNGATVQKNLSTGEIRTAVTRPPKEGGEGGLPKPPIGYRWTEDGKSLEIIPGGPKATQGSREATFNNRVIMSANQASKDLENVVQLPTTSSSGVFGGRKQGPGLFDATKEVLANKMTSQEVQAYNVMSTGFQRSLASIEAAGLMPSGVLTGQMDAVIFKEGDTNQTKLHKLAQTRQIVESGIETIMSNDRVSDSQKEQAKAILDRITKAVPFSHTDLIKLQQEQEKNPKATLNSIMKKQSEGATYKVGDKSTSKSGKPIHWDGKQWVYD